MNRILLALLLVFVGVGLIGGFWVVGGPAYGRMEQNDAKRASDLRRLAEHYRCLDAVETEDGISPRNCSGQQALPEVHDPVTEEAYRYRETGGTEFEVCATFETDLYTPDGHRNRMFYFDGQNGCLRYRRARIGTHWVQQ